MAMIQHRYYLENEGINRLTLDTRIIHQANPPMPYNRVRFLLAQMVLCALRLPRVRPFATQGVRVTTTRQGPLLVRLLGTSEEVGHEHKTLAQGMFVAEIEIKKSRFIAYAKHTPTWDSAQAFIAEIKTQQHPKARHWCYAFRAGSNPVNERSGDDGEPTGTAGVPILNAIRGEGLSDTLCLVVRYFGGVKLGAGGLIRAYGGAAREVLRKAEVKVLIPTSTALVKVNASHVGSVYELVAKFSATPSEEEFLADGSMQVKITCESAHMDAFCSSLTDATRGEAEIDRDAA